MPRVPPVDLNEREDPRMSLTIVIPAYNEEQRIGPTLDAAARELREGVLQDLASVEVIVVDDGSKDDTASEVLRRQPNFPSPLRLLREPHRGKGGAVVAGMLAAREAAILLCDADLAMSFDQVPKFLGAVQTPRDVVIGSREGQEARRIDEPFYRHLLGRGFNFLVRSLLVRGVHDTQCGYKLFPREVAHVVFELVRIRGFGFDVEVLYLLRKMNCPVREIPIVWHHRPESKVRPWRDGVAMFGHVLGIRWRAWMGRYRLPPQGGGTGQ